MASTKQHFSIDLHCQECKGQCFVAGDNAKTQKNALQLFGIIPNNCVNSKNGEVHCPFNS